MDFKTVIGVAASVLTGASLVPQLIKVINEKSSKGISFIMLLVLLAGVGLWVWYGLLKKDPIIIISNAVSACINIGIFAMSYYYKRTEANSGIG